MILHTFHRHASYYTYFLNNSHMADNWTVIGYSGVNLSKVGLDFVGLKCLQGLTESMEVCFSLYV